MRWVKFQASAVPNETTKLIPHSIMWFFFLLGGKHLVKGILHTISCVKLEISFQNIGVEKACGTKGDARMGRGIVVIAFESTTYV